MATRNRASRGEDQKEMYGRVRKWTEEWIDATGQPKLARGLAFYRWKPTGKIVFSQRTRRTFCIIGASAVFIDTLFPFCSRCAVERPSTVGRRRPDIKPVATPGGRPWPPAFMRPAVAPGVTAAPNMPKISLKLKLTTSQTPASTGNPQQNQAAS